MIFRKSPELQIETFSESFGNSMDRNLNLRILLKDGIFRNVSGELLRCFSPFFNSILKDLPCCTSPTLLIPDVSAKCVDHMLSIVSTGMTTFSSAMSIHQIQQIKQAATMMWIDLTNLEFNNTAKTKRKMFPPMDKPVNANSEALLESDSESVLFNSDEEEYYGENLEWDTTTATIVDISVENPPNQLLVPTIFFKIEPKSHKTNSHTTKRSRQYFQRVKSVKRGAMFVAHGVVRRGFEILHTI